MAEAKRKRFIPPLAGFKGYQLKMIPDDLIAGLVIAALSIPIAMGYAEIAGLPAIYGLYASIVAPLAYALITSTKQIVFGMDSATVAVTGSMLAAVGISLNTPQTVAVMPLLTLLTALFLFLFVIFKAGKIIRLIPLPVMHGFIFGIAVEVILGQIPLLTGTKADMSGGFISDVINVFSALPVANIPSVVMAVLCLAGLILFNKFFPKIPAALVVLLGAAIAAAALNLSSQGMLMLPAVEGSIPTPQMPDLTAADFLSVVIAAFAIAVIVTLETLLCLETFSLRTGVRADHNRELFSSGIATVATGIFGCPPCAGTLSRTAASITSGSHSQLAAIFSSVIVLLAAVICGPYISLLPRVALSAIVVIALARVVDVSSIKRYLRFAPYEFAVFCLSAFIVLFFGAIPGVIVGTIISVVIILYRRYKASSGELFGTMRYYETESTADKKDLIIGFNVLEFRLYGHVTFLNIDKIIEKLDQRMTPEINALILRLSLLETIDATAADKLLQQLKSYMDRDIHIKIVRKVRPVNDRFTIYELLNLMKEIKFYQNAKAALVSFKREYELGMSAQAASDWIEENEILSDTLPVLNGDRPILYLNSQDNPLQLSNLSGKVQFIQTEKTYSFEAEYVDSHNFNSDNLPFTKLKITSVDDNKLVADYHDETWFKPENFEDIKPLVSPIKFYMTMRLNNK